MRTKIGLKLLTASLLLTAPVVLAEAKKEDAAMLQTLRKAQGMLRQVSQEKAELETRNAQLQDQVTSLEGRVKELAPLEAQVREARASLDQMHSQNEGLQHRISEGADRYRSLAEKERSTAAELSQFKRDNQTLVDAVRERSGWVDSCTQKNADLLNINRELVGKYQSKGFWTKVREIEPFIQTGQVDKENEAQGYRYRLEDLQVTPWQETTVSQGSEGDPSAR
jgi:septal ring factor EnvC (AmiA/AmiB activator)